MKRNAGTGKEFVVDTGLTVSKIPPDEELKRNKRVLPITRKYQIFSKNEVNFIRKITVEAENRKLIKI